MAPTDHIAVEARRLSKVFRLYAQQSHRLLEWVTLGRYRCHRAVPALRDVSFEVRRGEALGIIGDNGSGKSTLLRLLGGILTPTSGEVTLHYPASVLIELAAGYDIQAAGRDNIVFQCRLLGMSAAEIAERMDEIVEFAELGPAIEMPMKTYSSGMKLRLAFSVALGLRREIMLLDEVLAVGDEYFQSKCFRRIKEIKRSDQTILYVSHALGTVRSVCERTIWLRQGELAAEGESWRVIDKYMDYVRGRMGLFSLPPSADEELCEPEEEQQQDQAPGEDTPRPAAQETAAQDQDAEDKAGDEEAGDGPTFVRIPGTELPSAEAADETGDETGDGPTFMIPEKKATTGLLGAVANASRCTNTYSWRRIGRKTTAGTSSIGFLLRNPFMRIPGTELPSAALPATRSAAASAAGPALGRLIGEGDAGGKPWPNYLPQLHAPEPVRLGQEGDAAMAAPSDAESSRLSDMALLPHARQGSHEVEIFQVETLDCRGEMQGCFTAGEPLTIRLHLMAHQPVERPNVGVAIYRNDGLLVFGTSTFKDDVVIELVAGRSVVDFVVPSLAILSGSYQITCAIFDEEDIYKYDYHTRLYPFRVKNPRHDEGVMRLTHRWQMRGGGSGMRPRRAADAGQRPGGD